MRTPYVVPNRIYSQQGLEPKDRDNLVELMSMPCDIFESGMVWIYYQAMALPDSLTKWDVLYFARSAVKSKSLKKLHVHTGRMGFPMSFTRNSLLLTRNSIL